MQDSKEESSFEVMGISIRTSNISAVKDNTITNLWQRFLQEGWSDKIPNKLYRNIIIVYYGYDTNKDGEYSVLIGHRVIPVKIDQTNILIGATTVYVTAQKMLSFSTNSQCSDVLSLWKRIWQLQEDKKISRKYRVDYELYPKDGPPVIHIGVN